MAVFQSMPLNSLKWLVSNCAAGVRRRFGQQLGSDRIQQPGRLRGYKDSSNSSFWQNMYIPLDEIECHYGFYGLVYDNIVISLKDAAGDDLEPNLHEGP